jgi:DNA-binding MarR family transcriptional regulator
VPALRKSSVTNARSGRTSHQIRSGASSGTAANVGRARSDARASAVLRHIRELLRVAQQHFQRVEARCGISGAQLWALYELRARPGMRISELAAALSVHLSTASNLLDRMEAKLLVRRERGTHDQRVVRVYMTAAGNKTLARAPKPVQGVIPEALRKMPDAVLARLDRDLEQLLRLAGKRSPSAAMEPLADI